MKKNNTIYLRIVTLLMLLMLWKGSLYADDIPDPMSPHRLVNDFAGIFSIEQKQDLESLLRSYNDTTSTQIYVVTMSDLNGYPASDMAVKIGEKWGVGQKDKNNGAVILIKPKVENSRGDLYIATGYGLEEKLTDARCGRIMDNYMIPYFQQKDYYNGTKQGIYAMIKYLSGQFKADEKSNNNPGMEGIVFLVIFVVIFIIIFSKSSKGNGDDDDRDGGAGGNGRFFPPFLGGGGFGSGRSGGGFGGGSFGGGGGGSFGGGGAGRGW